MGMYKLASGTSSDDAHCQAWGEPHIQTWSNGITSRSGLCLVSGWHPLMINEWISFSIKISSGYTVQMAINFRDGNSKDICSVQWVSNFQMTFTKSLCNTHGINILGPVKNGFLDFTSIYHNAAGITITVTHDSNVTNPHLNINLWKPPHQNATGLCTDNRCNTALARSISLMQPLKISNEAATRICQDYLDGYLENLSLTPLQRNRQYNETIRVFQESCIFDVSVTGQADAAASAIQMLMVQELTNDVSNVRSGASKFRTDFLKASRLYEQAKLEAKAKIARKRILQ